MKTPPPRQRVNGKKGAPPAGSRAAGLLVPVLVFLLVTGAGVAALSPRGGSEPTFTERAQQASANRARDLAADAAVLAASAPTAGYAETAELLGAQARGLAPAGPAGAQGQDSGTRSGTEPGVPESTAGSTAPAVPVTPAGFLEDLMASAGRNLSDAVKAEPGIARLLASVGSSQWQQAASLGALLGLPVEAPGAAGLDAADSPECTDEPRGSAEQRRALLSAVRTEDRAVYAYEVAAARLPDPEVLLAASREHAEVAAAATSALAGLCAPPAPVPPAYALAPEFLADPAAGIARLEQELGVFYGSVVGSGGPALRGWAVGRLTTAVQRSFALDGVAEPFPGIPVEEQALPAAESTDGANAEDTGKP
ncbi:DUF4439 domain-containing protein [Arthrobacter sp. MSA 4-2]|uniref:DUF4439 domain-containing protein n=1 Tax=Arthrobacter sp. MSA 4-2 TaxID=2794349 RepID=UPI0018E6EBA4|nr:DUF4439 domain-containing protein [Arthrobacter sp. MSA 4-2]MBJ2121251.1 DUF4439 domain-containing protein [Arthrobacter sp. MSA 4-2]